MLTAIPNTRSAGIDVAGMIKYFLKGKDTFCGLSSTTVILMAFFQYIFSLRIFFTLTMISTKNAAALETQHLFDKGNSSDSTSSSTCTGDYSMPT